MKSCKSGLLEMLLKKSIFKSLKYSKKNIRHRERERERGRERERERERVKWSSTHDFTKFTLCNFKKKKQFSVKQTPLMGLFLKTVSDAITSVVGVWFLLLYSRNKSSASQKNCLSPGRLYCPLWLPHFLGITCPAL